MKDTNELVDALYKTIDAQNKTINEQALEISQLKNEIKMRIEYAEKYKNEIIGSHKKIAQLKEQKKQAIEYIKTTYCFDTTEPLELLQMENYNKLLELLGDGNNE